MPYDPERHGPVRVIGPGFNIKTYAVVQTVPPGSVTTYGDVATQLGLRTAARQVGYALAATPVDRDVPWHRVVNSRGMLSFSLETEQGRLQKKLRAREGITVDDKGRVDSFSKLRFVYS